MCEARHREHMCECGVNFSVLHDFIPCGDPVANRAIRALDPRDTPRAAVERLGHQVKETCEINTPISDLCKNCKDTHLARVTVILNQREPLG
jgi:hypothetical protein